MKETDEQLVSAYLRGNDNALKELIERYTAPIFNFVYRSGIHTETADVTQEIFLKAWKNIKKFNIQKSSLKTWLYIIARTTSIDFMRKRKEITFSDMEEHSSDRAFSDTIIDIAPLVTEVIDRLESKNLLNEALSKLPQNYQTVLTLHYHEEMTFEEIGLVLNKPLNTVKSWHQRAIIKLRQIVIDN